MLSDIRSGRGYRQMNRTKMYGEFQLKPVKKRNVVLRYSSHFNLQINPHFSRNKFLAFYLYAMLRSEVKKHLTQKLLLLNVGNDVE